MWRQIWPWILMIAAAFFLMETFYGQASVPEVSYSQFIEDVKNGMVSEVRFEGDGITVTGTRSSDGSRFSTVRPVNVYDGELVSDLYENNVTMVGAVPERPGLLQQLFVATFPLLVLAACSCSSCARPAAAAWAPRAAPCPLAKTRPSCCRAAR